MERLEEYCEGLIINIETVIVSELFLSDSNGRVSRLDHSASVSPDDGSSVSSTRTKAVDPHLHAVVPIN